MVVLWSVKTDRSLSPPLFQVIFYFRLKVFGLWDFCTLCQQFSNPSVGKEIWPFLYNILVILAVSRTLRSKNHIDLYLFISWHYQWMHETGIISEPASEGCYSFGITHNSLLRQCLIQFLVLLLIPLLSTIDSNIILKNAAEDIYLNWYRWSSLN